MERILKEILEKLEGLSSDVKEMKPRLDELHSLKPKIEESHEWLGALYDANKFHKADIDQVQLKIAKIEGTIKGAAKQVLNELKEVSNK